MWITVWMPFENLSIVPQNCEKFIEKRWTDMIKECAILVSGRDRDQGTIFCVIAYTNDPKKVGRLASDLLEMALEGHTKVYSAELKLYDEVRSDKEKCVQDVRSLKMSYDRWLSAVLDKFKDEPRVKRFVEEGMKVVVTADTEVICELGSDVTNKIVIYAVGLNLNDDLQMIDQLTGSLVKRELASGVAGYRLVDRLDELVVEEVVDEGDHVWLRVVRQKSNK